MQTLTEEQRSRWVQQWKNASEALAAQRAIELRSMTTSEAWDATESLLSFPVTTPLGPERETSSGLVVLQRYLLQLGHP